MQLDDQAEKARKAELARERGRRYRERNRDRVREMARARRAKWTRENPIGARSAQLKYYYGIDEAQYAEMLKSQGGVCAICSCKPPEGKILHVDHCHATGLIRGLLCRDCNLAIGHFKDREDSMKNAIEYLRRSKAKVTLPHAA